MNRSVTIGKLARRTGVPATTIRYDQQVEVLPAPRRIPSGYRQYAQPDVHRLKERVLLQSPPLWWVS